MMRRIGLSALAVAWAVSTGATAPAPDPRAESDGFLATTILTTVKDAPTIDARCTAALALAQKLRTGLESRKGPATIKGDFQSFDALVNLLGGIGNEMGLIKETNPAKPVRDAAQGCVEKISAAGTDLSLSRPVYDRLSAIPAANLDPATAFTLNKQLLDYRLAGVDRDAATRAKIAAMQKEITEIGLAFDRNISEYKGEIVLDGPAALAGMPQDYLDAHKPGADGKIRLTTSYPDIFPILDYAEVRATRKAVMLAFVNRAYPENGPVLAKLIAKRQELAKLLGFPNYATLITKDKMIGSPARAREFLDELNSAATPAAEADLARTLARLKQIDPSATSVTAWDSGYVNGLIRKEQYSVDSALVRQYFTLDKTRSGIFRLMKDLFGADIRPWKTETWAPGVTAWELWDGQRLVGRFFLDLSPRDGKFSHAAQFDIRTGLEGRQVPIAALVCNFPETGPMDHDDVTTFLHEFGHLIHNLYSGHQQYSTQGMGALQWDFIEAPSQLLEEWTWDYDTLKTFASNPAGETIPADLVAKMNAARHFGEAGGWKRQLGFSAVSLAYYDRPAGFDLDQVYREQENRYALIPMPAEGHMYASFGHLNGYSAIYYTYAWSKAISLDMLTRFRAAGIRDQATAMAYRKAVLDPGGSKPAGALIRDFLGREPNTDAIRKELSGRKE